MTATVYLQFIKGRKCKNPKALRGEIDIGKDRTAILFSRPDEKALVLAMMCTTELLFMSKNGFLIKGLEKNMAGNKFWYQEWWVTLRIPQGEPT